jgi:hypothetical protein
VDLPEALKALMPRAVAWAQDEAAAGASAGRAASPAELDVARRVGVRAPERIRIVAVEALPAPADPALREAAVRTGLLDPRMVGLTLGHTVFVRHGHESARLLAHEFRHVFQYETAGSIAGFLPEYVRQVAEHGYFDAPFERDARAHEAHA